jgi:hypothetical protein
LASPRKDSPPPLPKSGRQRAAGVSREPASAAPELRVGYSPAESETLTAITEELADKASDEAPGSAPRLHHEIIVEEDELTLPRMPRTRVNTTSYGDRLANAPGAVTPSTPAKPPRPGGKSRPPAGQKSGPFTAAQPPRPVERLAPSRPLPEPVKREPFQLSSPDLLRAPQISISEIRAESPLIDLGDGEPDTGVRTRHQTMDFAERPRNRDTSPEVITIEERPIGRETLAAIAEELARENAAFLRDLPQEEDAPLEIMEMVTFVVRGAEVMRLSSEAARREFVAERLMHRLPVSSAEEIDRIDVTPWTVRGTVVLRVWCRVPVA